MMTEQERREARREASRRCYLKRKAAAGGDAKKAFAFQAKRNKAERASADAVKVAEKVAKRGAKAMSQAKAVIKDAAAALAAVCKSCDEKTVARIQRVFAKDLRLVVSDQADGKKALTFADASRSFAAPCPAKPVTEDETPEPDVIPVDPDEIKAIADGEQTDVDGEYEQDGEAEPEEDEDEDDLTEDEDDLTEDERRERDERMLDEDYAAGRADAMRELDAQGWGEEN